MDLPPTTPTQKVLIVLFVKQQKFHEAKVTFDDVVSESSNDCCSGRPRSRRPTQKQVCSMETKQRKEFPAANANEGC